LSRTAHDNEWWNAFLTAEERRTAPEEATRPAAPEPGAPSEAPASGPVRVLVHVNTLLLQQILADPEWAERLTDADRRALPSPFWTHVNPYGRFELDMNNRLDLALGSAVPGPRTVLDARAVKPTSPADGAGSRGA
jgi:hypothetical protein